MARKNNKFFLKCFTIFTIYLIISLTFFTAQTFARLDYSISGDRDIEGYARRQGDSIKISTTSDSPVSFVTGTGTSNYREIPLNGCTNDSNNVVTCDYGFSPSQINTNLKTVSFTLKQQTGSPQYKNGLLYVDSLPPQLDNLEIVKNASGLLFKYAATDYLYSYSQNDCTGSGIGKIEIVVQGRSYIAHEDYENKNCSINGEYFVELQGLNTETLAYHLVFEDRSGNSYTTDDVVTNGDFSAPAIQDTFTITIGTQELTQISGSSETIADIHVIVEDTNISIDGVSGDLSSLNINPAINIPYKNVKATCTKDTGNVYNCVFNSIVLKPTSGNLQIVITATDRDGNVATKTVSSFVELKNNPGQVLFIGTLKDHCTQDLTACYAKSGMTLFRVEIDGQSSYEKNVLNLGVDSKRTFAICAKDESGQKWLCTSAYNIPRDSSSVSLFLADSADDFGNRLSSDIERTVYVDNIAPTKTSDLKVVNSNNNNNCSVAGDELTFEFRVKESTSPELKLYSNTTNFTTSPMQTGSCDKISDDEWSCILTIKDFSSVPNTLNNDIIVEDLAGNKLQIPYTFRICKASSDKPPNTITGFIQTNIPKIDRRTASIIPIKTYINGNFKVISGAQLMYLQIDRCTSKGIDGLDIMSTGHYFIPGYGASQTLVLNIGHEQAQLPEGRVVINCTVSARINIGTTVYNSDEREVVQLNIDTFNQPLGSLDDTTIEEIRSQKRALRDLDDELEIYELIDDIVGTICDISDIIVKVNSILQAIKAVMYPICLLLQAFGGSGIWQVVNNVGTNVDRIVDKFVWPTGGAGVAVGYIWKYLCIAYNCRFYTMSGLVEIGFDAAGFIKKANADKIVGTPEKIYTNDKGEIVTPDANGDLPEGEYTTKTTTTYKDGRVETTETTTTVKKDYAIDHDAGTWDPDQPAPVITSQSSVQTKTTTYKNGDTEITTLNNGKPVSTTKTTNYLGGKTEETTNLDSNGNPSSRTTNYYASDGKTLTRSTTVNLGTTSTGGVGTVTETLYNSKGAPLPSTTYTLVPNAQTSSNGGLFGGIGRSLISGGGGTNSQYKILAPTGTNGQPAPVSQYISNSYQTLASGGSTTGNPGSGAYFKDKDGNFVLGGAQGVNNDYSVYTLGAQGAIYNDIARQDWIINPYRSVYYDGLCVPAIMYNMQKERQIRCMYVQCLEDSQNNGMPVSVCKNLYATNNCIYLESAQHVLDKNIWESIGRGFVQQAISFAMGFAIQYTYRAVCEQYVQRSDAGTLEVDGWSFAGCGLFGAALKWQEVAEILKSPQEVMKNLFKGAGVGDPEDIHDYCDGGKLYDN